MNHGPLRLLFTTAEEVGLEGAKEVAPDWLAGAEYLLNTDGFHLGRAVVGSASGRRETWAAPLDAGPAPALPAWRLTLSGGRGGHSGDDINRGRANPIKLLAAYLAGLPGGRIASLSGGLTHNAIPAQAEAVVFCPAEPDLSPLRAALAGYRAAFLAGDARLVGAVTEVRKHTGMLMPTPVQAALVAALGDEAHMEVQKEVYRERREVLVEATAAAGLVNDPASVAGLYLWLRGPESMSAYELVGAFAELGIVVAPGDFYGEAGAGRVRMSLTDTDERVAAAAARLRSPDAAALFAG